MGAEFFKYEEKISVFENTTATCVTVFQVKLCLLLRLSDNRQRLGEVFEVGRFSIFLAFQQILRARLICFVIESILFDRLSRGRRINRCRINAQ